MHNNNFEQGHHQSATLSVLIFASVLVMSNQCVACTDVGSLSSGSPSDPVLSEAVEEEEQPGEIDGTGSEAIDPNAHASLPAPISESEELQPPIDSVTIEGSATMSGTLGKLATKEFSSGIVAIYESGRWIASFTKGARTVRVVGSMRTLRDPTEIGSAGGVTHDQYVRLLPKPFVSFGDAEKAWLDDRRADPSHDVLGIAAEYFDGKPLDPTYIFGSDYSDYLAARTKATRGIDCSGFVRLVYAKRTLPSLLTNALLPRVSKDQLTRGTGVLTVANDGMQPAPRELERLRAGDVVFFDVSTRNDDAGGIDHVGFYVGKDSAGNMRFVSSTPNNGAMTGPTMATKFILNGASFWARHFRAARRL